MNLASIKTQGKPKMPMRMRPGTKEGLKIRYKIHDIGMNLVNIAKSLTIDPSNISKVITGQRRSKRIEAEIARILGKADWNEVVLEARSEVQKKPIKQIIKEMQQKQAVREKASKEQFARQTKRTGPVDRLNAKDLKGTEWEKFL